MSQSIWKKLLTPSFITATVVLAVAALALDRVVAMNQWVLQKQPIELRRGLERMPTSLGPYYTVVEKEPRLPSEQEHALGTDQYISWVFQDTRLERDEPGALLRLHVPYYTGTIDTVPHVPDRCFIAGSEARIVSKQLASTPLRSEYIETTESGVLAQSTAGLVALPDESVPVTVIQFADPLRAGETFCATYFFIANNNFVATPEGVRLKAFNLIDRYAYHCKVEVIPVGVGDAEEALRVTGEFLAYALPEIMACLPDWRKLKGESPQELAQ